MTDDQPRLLSFDSDDIAPGQRFAQYRALYLRGTDAIELGPRFRAVMRGASLDRAIVYDRILADVGHERTAARCRRDAFEHFTLTLTLDGEFHADGGAGFARIAPGEIVLMDMTKPMRNRADDAHVITLGMARARIASVMGKRVADLHGHVIDAGRGILLADHLRSLARHMTGIRGEMLIPLSRMSADMLATAIGGDGNTQAGLERYAQMLRLDLVTAFIEQNLSSRELDAATIIDRFGISRATLYRMFHAHGGVGRYIRRRRLAILRARLSDPGHASPLGDMAVEAGFGTEAIASEAFVTEFGIRPGGYRRKAARETKIERAHRQFHEWLAELV
jgi:AraC-like DNA-binding protein